MPSGKYRAAPACLPASASIHCLEEILHLREDRPARGQVKSERPELQPPRQRGRSREKPSFRKPLCDWKPAADPESLGGDFQAWRGLLPLIFIAIDLVDDI